MNKNRIRLYQTEVIGIPINSPRRELVEDIAKEFGRLASGNFDLTYRRRDPNIFSLFKSEDSAKRFRKAIFERRISGAVYITPLENREYI